MGARALARPVRGTPLLQGDGGAHTAMAVWEGEGFRPFTHNLIDRIPSSSRRSAAGPSFSLWEKGIGAP